MGVFDMDNLGVHTPEWFDAAFEGMDVSARVRAWSIAFCLKHNIRGQSDPGYIANVFLGEGGNEILAIERLSRSYQLPKGD